MRASSVYTFLLLALFAVPALAQDTTNALSVTRFIEQVRTYHPVARQANLLTEMAEANLLAARGAFDPVAELTNNAKSLDGTNYYRNTNPELRLPTAFGVELKTGFERNEGVYLNPERTKGVATYLGLEIPVLNGLLIDKRRAALQQAKIISTRSEQERLAAYNNLLFDAYTTYWQWAGAHQLLQVYQEFEAISAERLALVRLLFENGDRPMADTVEAHSQLLNYRLLATAALQERNRQAIELSGYLWSEAGNPMLLPENAIPDSLSTNLEAPEALQAEVMNNIILNHPELRAYRFKLQEMDVELRLKRQELLPVLKLKANLLSKEYYDYKEINPAYFRNNHQWGLTFKMPLLLREARGAYRNAQLKIESANLDIARKSFQIEQKILQYLNEAKLLRSQLQTATSMYNDLSFLLKTEELKFSQGESALFLINSRESKVIETQQKLVELQVKYLKALYAIEWASGRMR